MDPRRDGGGGVLVLYKVLSINNLHEQSNFSLRVDKFGRHITGMGHYGFCSSNCPGMRGHEEYFSVNSSSVEAERNVPVIFEDEISVILGYPN